MKWYFIILIVLLCILGLFLLFFIFTQKPTITSNVVAPTENQLIEVHFCPKEDCSQIIALKMAQAKIINCALYNFDDKRILEQLEKKESKVFSDNNYQEKLGYLPYIRFDTKDSLMHDKFCILDSKIVITGSYNPVTRASKDINNVVIINSQEIAKTYEVEFDELWNYNKNTKSTKNNYGDIELYFCPEDGCQKAVISKVNQAKNSIKFMTYSFTDKEIANSILVKSKEGVAVSGIYEKGQIKDATYDLLNYQNVDVKIYDGVGLLHNKVFIIDDYVITGSYNPTNNGNRANDENMIIIHDANIAKSYLMEYDSIYRNLNKQ